MSVIETPVIDTCDQGHKFAKLPDHPVKDGKSRCPHCMATGLDEMRSAYEDLEGEIMARGERD